MYKLIISLPSKQISCICRLADNTFIPFDPDNSDYQIYLKWLEEGNVPEPAEGAE
jgi:hypothetical protein